MASLTTLFVVGPNEYVEFNESWGSKAFLHHIWDQSQSPLDHKDLAQVQLHSAGARISKSKPPRIEFPVVFRAKGKGSTYKPSGKWISWDELAKRNPLAVKPPPSLDEFIAAGATVGTGPQLRPGEFASKADPIDRIKPPRSVQSQSAKSTKMTKAKTPIMDLETDEDGWIGGSSQSIYASKPKAEPVNHASPPPAARTANKPSPVTPGRDKSQSGDTKSRSLLERMDMAQNLQTPPPKARNGQTDADRSSGAASTPSPSSNSATSPFRSTPSQGIRRPGAKIPSPLPLTSPARNNAPVSPLNTRTPLSASHPIPETPLKLSQRGGPQTPATPHYPSYPASSHAHNHDGDAARASGLGLGLTPLKTSVPLAPSPDNVRSPLNEALNLRGRAASNASIGSPLKSSRSDLHGEPLALGSSTNQSGNGQIDAMLDRLRNTRSGLGTSASMWAPKPAADSASSTSSTSHTIGAGFSSSNLLGVQTGLDRKRPSHRPNGLQLSLGQEISVMQELEEKAEEDYAPSTLSSATVSETFRIDPPDNEAEHADQDGWQGTIVPPTPSLGCDSPSSDEDSGAAKAPSRSLDAFGWGSHARNNSHKSSLFSKLPSSSTVEANWSGDDDDDRKDDVEVFEDMQNRAKASSKEKRSNAFAPLPPPPLNYAKSRTPSPTHRMLAKSPQLDRPADYGEKSTSAPALNPAAGLGTSPSVAESGASKASVQRLSPASARSQLPSEDSDGDADVETEKPTQRKTSKKHDVKPAAAEDDPKSNSLHVESGGLEKKRSLKRDKSERIRGRRASQSKEKDVDKVKMTAPTSSSATVSLPTSTLSRHAADDLAQSVEKVTLNEEKDKLPVSDHAASTAEGASDSKAGVTSKAEAQQTPVANRVQSIPTVKDDLFSSPAEPKVELPGSAGGAEEAMSQPKEEVVPATPEPTHQKTMSFDWAADDDELDDELPDLDDWGVTLTPAKPSATGEAESAALKAADKPARNGKGKKEDAGDKTWRKGGMHDAMSKGKSKLPSSDDSSSGRKGKAAGRELFPPTAGKGSADGGPLGIRIAGRAKEASLSPEPESASSKAQPPPASTPYGRWNKTTPSSQPQDELSIKGSSNSASRKPQAPKKEETGPKVRPRIAADLGALAKLLQPVDEPPKQGQSQGGAKGKSGGSRKTSPAPDRGEEWTRDTKKNKEKASVGESMHAVPSVGDSMHAPKNRTGAAPSAGARPAGGAKKKPHGGKK